MKSISFGRRVTALVMSAVLLFTVVFAAMPVAVATAQAIPSWMSVEGDSLMPDSSNGWSWTPVATTDGVYPAIKPDGYGGFSVQPAVSTPNNPGLTVDYGSADPKVYLYDQIYYNIQVDTAATVWLYVSDHLVYLNSLMDTSKGYKDSLGAGQYEGYISFNDIIQLGKANGCFKSGSTEVDVVDSGEVTLTRLQMYIRGNLNALKIVRHQVHNGPLSLMPTASQIAGISNLSYDSEGYLVANLSAGAKVTFPVGKYYNIASYPKMHYNVTSDQVYNITVNGVGIGTSSDKLEAKGSNLQGDWALPCTPCSNLTGVVNFIGSPNWAKVIPKNNVYYVESVTLTLSAAGTLKVRGLVMDTESGAPKPGAVSMSLDSVNATPGQTVKVPLVLDSANGVANFDLTVDYDPSVLTPGEAEWNESVVRTDSDNVYSAYVSGGKWKFVFIGEKSSAPSGVVAYLPFTVASGAMSGVSSLDMTMGDLQVYNTLNPDSFGASDPVAVYTTDGEIVIEKQPLTVTVGSTTVKAGDTFTVPVTVPDNHYLTAARMDLSFDTSVLELVTVNADDENNPYASDVNTTMFGSNAVYMSYLKADGCVRFAVSSSADSGKAAGGTIYKLTFRVKNTAKNGTTPLNLTVQELYASVNAEDFALDYQVVNGVVTISNGSTTTTKKTTTTTTTTTTKKSTTTTTTTTTTKVTSTTTTAPVTLPSAKDGEIYFVAVSNNHALTTDDTITVDLMMSSVQGAANFGVSLSYDTSVLTPVQVGDGFFVWNEDVMGKASANRMFSDSCKNGELNIAYVAIDRNTTKAVGKIGTVTFKVNANCLNGKATASVTLLPSCSDATYYNPTHADADKSGYVALDEKPISDTVTVYQKMTIVHKNDNGTVVKEETVPNTGADMVIEHPDTDPKKLNYAFIKWNKVSETANRIELKPIYGYTVEVSGGKIAGQFVQTADHWLSDDDTKAYFDKIVRTDATEEQFGNLLGYDSHVQIIAGKAPTGREFSHWVDQHGNIVSYQSTYSFYIPGNVRLTAVYAATAVPQTPAVAMQTVRGEYDAAAAVGSITWVCATNMGDTARYRVEEVGVYYSTDAVYLEELRSTGVATNMTPKIKANNISLGSGQYSITLNKVKADRTRVAIAYATYIDTQNNNRTYTVYSANVMAFTMTANTL